MAMIHATTPDIFDAAFSAIFYAPFKEWEPIFPKYFDVKPSDRKDEKMAVFAGLDYLVEKTVGGGFTYKDFSEGYSTTATHTTYSLGVSIAREAIEDDLFNILAKAPAILSRSARLTMEKIAADVLNNGFSSSYTYGDGVALFHTAHPRLNAASYANKPTVDVDLSVGALNDALTNLRNSTDQSALPQMAIPQRVIIPSDSLATAFELVKSPDKPGTANNDKNFLYTQGLEIIVNPFLTDNDSWFVQCDVNGLVYYVRVKPETETERDPNNGNLLYRVRFRGKPWVAFPQGMYGSSGG